MADKTDIILWADDGDITVGRQSSSFIWGAWDVDAPEGSIDEVDQLLQDFKGWGYLYRPDDYQDWDRFDLLGKRADVSQKVGVNDDGEPDFALGESDTEQVLDDTQKEVAGEYFFQQSIPTSGLGNHIKPGRDFSVGDIVSVSRWGKLLTTPITKITAVDTGDGERWSIDVGDSPIRDISTLSAANSEISKRIKDDNQKMMQLIADQKVSIEQLVKFFGLGVGNSASGKFYKIVDGEKVEYNFLDYNYENFNKNFTKIIGGEILKKSQEELLLRAKEVFMAARSINSQELGGIYSDYQLIPPQWTFIDKGQTVDNKYYSITRTNDNKIIVNRMTIPFYLKVINISDGSHIDTAVSAGAEVWENDEAFSASGKKVDSDETWIMLCGLPKSNQFNAEPENSRELDLKHSGEDVAGKRVFLGYTNTGKSRLIGFYCSAVFTTPGEGRRIVVVEKSPKYGDKEYTIKPNVQWDSRVPAYPGVYSWGLLGFNAAADEDKGKERHYEIYIEADDNGEEHTLAGAYVGGNDFHTYITSVSYK